MGFSQIPFEFGIDRTEQIEYIIQYIKMKRINCIAACPHLLPSLRDADVTDWHNITYYYFRHVLST